MSDLVAVIKVMGVSYTILIKNCADELDAKDLVMNQFIYDKLERIGPKTGAEKFDLEI